MSGPVGWGILGAGRISTLAVGPALAASPLCSVNAVGARDVDRAAALGARLADLGGSAKSNAYGSYEQVIADPAVEVVYVALPNDAHVPWAIEALRAGKHVLCEKPLGMDVAEVRSAFDVAEESGALLVEASWYRWHPRTQDAERMVADGVVGNIATVEAEFVFEGVPVDDYRMDPGQGGGALYDVGCYAISAVGWTTGWAALGDFQVRTRSHSGGVDLSTWAQVEAGGAVATIRSAIDEPPFQRLDITGATGSLRFRPPVFSAWTADRTVLEVARDSAVSVREYEPCDPYLRMVEAVAGRAAGRDDWVVPRCDSEWIATVMDALRAPPGSNG